MWQHFQKQNSGLRSIVGFGMAMLVSIAMPIVLVRHLSPSDFSTWMLGQSIGVFLQWLALELQPQTAEKTLRALQSDEPLYPAWLRQVLKVVLTISLSFAAFAVLFSCLLFATAPGLHFDSHASMRWVFLSLVAAVYGLSIPTAVLYGVWQGEGRSELVPLSRALTLSLFLLGTIAIDTVFGAATLWTLLTVWFGVHFSALLLMVRYLYGKAGRYRSNKAPNAFTIKTVRDKKLLRGSARQAVFAFWTVIDIWIVALTYPLAVGGYQIATLVAGIIVGAQWTLASSHLSKFSTLGTQAARLDNRKTFAQLQTLSLSLSALGCITVFLVPVSVWTWLFKSTAPDALSVIVPLTLAAALRALQYPSTQLFIATGIQSRFASLISAECILKVFLCLLLGFLWGVRGVSWGVFAASLLSFAAYVRLTLQRTRDVIDLGLTDFFWPRQRIQ